jgi:hypothetical protein
MRPHAVVVVAATPGQDLRLPQLDALMGACRKVTGGAAVPQSDA